MHARAIQHPASSLTPATELLARVSAELTDMAAEVNRLHPLAGAHGSAAAKDPDYLKALQGIDHVEQKLRALAGFLADVAGAASPNWALDPRQAFNAITLSDLASRLAGDTVPEARHDGDCDFF